MGKSKSARNSSTTTTTKVDGLSPPEPKKHRRKISPDPAEITPHPTPKRTRSSSGASKDNEDQSMMAIDKRHPGGLDDIIKHERQDDPAPALTPTKPTLDVSVHRMRHLKYIPKAVLFMATTPSNIEASAYVAISREGGSVELCSPDEKWRTVALIPGLSTRNVDCMTWLCGCCDASSSMAAAGGTSTVTYASKYHESHVRTHANRILVGGSKDSTLFILDWAKGCHTAVTGSGGGGVVSLASLSGRTTCNAAACSQLIAAGCEDGSVRIYRVSRTEETNFSIDLESTIPIARTGILSLAWTATPEGTTLYAGVADGTIRRFDCRSKFELAKRTGMGVSTVTGATGASSALRTWKSVLRFTVESYGRSNPAKVWALLALSDGSVVSADSLGHVQFWDGGTGTQISTFDQNESKADVLALAVTQDECKVFASGVDSRVVCIQRQAKDTKGSTVGSMQRKWILSSVLRPHTHDVKALAVCQMKDVMGCLDGSTSSAEPREILCSAGIDTKVSTMLINNFAKKRPKHLFPWPAVSPICLANHARIVAMRRDHSIEIHRAGRKQDTSDLPVSLESNSTMLGTISLRDTHNLVCCDISACGTLLAVSDAVTFMLFEIEYEEDEDGDMRILPRKIELHGSLSVPCQTVSFASRETLICATLDGPINIIRIDERDDDNDSEASGETATEKTSFAVSPAQTIKETVGRHDLFPIQTVTASSDGSWFATSKGSMGNRDTRVYRLQGNTWEHWYSLPALESPISTIRFRTHEDVVELIVVCSNCASYVFDVKRKTLSDWSEGIGFPATENMPRDLKFSHFYPTRCVVNPAAPGMFLVGSFGSFCVFDTSSDLPKYCKTFPPSHVRGSKRKRRKSSVDGKKSSSAENNCAICLRYNGMLFLDFISDNEMLVVEQPWMDVVETFPDALDRKMYGT